MWPDASNSYCLYFPWCTSPLNGSWNKPILLSHFGLRISSQRHEKKWRQWSLDSCNKKTLYLPQIFPLLQRSGPGWLSARLPLPLVLLKLKWHSDQDSSKAQQNNLQHGQGLKTIHPSEGPCRQACRLLSVGRATCLVNTLLSVFIPNLHWTKNWRLEGKPPVNLVSTQGLCPSRLYPSLTTT